MHIKSTCFGRLKGPAFRDLADRVFPEFHYYGSAPDTASASLWAAACSDRALGALRPEPRINESPPVGNDPWRGQSNTVFGVRLRRGRLIFQLDGYVYKLEIFIKTIKMFVIDPELAASF